MARQPSNNSLRLSSRENHERKAVDDGFSSDDGGNDAAQVLQKPPAGILKENAALLEMELSMMPMSAKKAMRSATQAML